VAVTCAAAWGARVPCCTGSGDRDGRPVCFPLCLPTSVTHCPGNPNSQFWGNAFQLCAPVIFWDFTFYFFGHFTRVNPCCRMCVDVCLGLSLWFLVTSLWRSLPCVLVSFECGSVGFEDILVYEGCTGVTSGVCVPGARAHLVRKLWFCPGPAAGPESSSWCPAALGSTVHLQVASSGLSLVFCPHPLSLVLSSPLSP
jgi:hypothetical protein